MRKTEQSDRTYRTLPPLEPEELRTARSVLGSRWGLGRPVSKLEMAEMLGLSSKDQYAKMERDPERISGPVSAAVRAWVLGQPPANAPKADGEPSF